MTLPDRPVIRSELDPDPLHVWDEENRAIAEWERERAAAVCPACHHKDHDPGSCNWCPRCELHTDEALDFVLRIEPGLLAERGYFTEEHRRLARHSHLGAIVVVSAVLVLSVIAAVFLLWFTA